MRADLTQKLYADFPDLFCQHTNPRSLLHHGFACDDGWYDIIYTLSSQITAIVSRLAKAHASNIQNKVGSKPDSGSDKPDMIRTDQQDEFDPRKYSASQVKEKFGVLRFYMNRYNDEINVAIADAEAKTETTCESCGGVGSMREDGWIRVLCDPCEEVRQAMIRDRMRPRRDSGVGMDPVS